MHLTNLHTHTVYCDGKCTTEEMIQAAIKCNFQSIGISTHGPVPFFTDWNIQEFNIERYIEEVTLLKEKYMDEIDVFLGMELDYIPGVGFDERIRSIMGRLDYYIGSVHFMGKPNREGRMWTIDYTIEELLLGIKENFHGNVRLAVEAYYNLISEMAERYQPPVIGHIDLIKKLNKNNLLFDENENWYIIAIEKCLDTIKNTKSIIEINTGGISRNYTLEQYPSTFILKMIKKKEIPVMINSDAHTAEGINCKFEEMQDLVKVLGFGRLSLLTKEGWSAQEI